MIETRERLVQIRRRVSRYRSRFEKRAIGFLCVLCTGLTAGMGYLLHTEQTPGVFTMESEYGAVLLHSSGEPYIVIGVFSFLGGAAFTLLCIRFSRIRRRREAEEGMT